MRRDHPATQAVCIMRFTNNSYTTVFAFSMIPAIFAIIIPLTIITEPTREKLHHRLRNIKVMNGTAAPCATLPNPTSHGHSCWVGGAFPPRRVQWFVNSSL